jgi:type II secretory pathway pseudopilin PulG
MQGNRGDSPLPRGALLAELLIALALLIMVTVLVAGLFPYSFSVDRHAWNQRTAHSLARSALERTRGQRFEQMASFQQTVSKDGTNFVVEVQVSEASLPLEEREKDVVCTVTWPRQNGVDRFVMQTRVARLHQALD